MIPSYSESKDLDYIQPLQLLVKVVEDKNKADGVRNMRLMHLPAMDEGTMLWDENLVKSGVDGREKLKIAAGLHRGRKNT